MRKRVVIEIDIDDESFGTTRLIMKPIFSNHNFRIEIRSDIHRITSAPNVVAAALAHELGHMIGSICQLPAASCDPRIGAARAFENGTFEDLVMNSEREAWDVAEMIFSIRQARRDALASHEEVLFGHTTGTSNPVNDGRAGE